MAKATAISKAYRGLLRELVKSATSPRSSRNSRITANIRQALLSNTTQTQDLNLQKTIRNIENVTAYLGSERKYKELLERYNPTHNMTEQERVHATARRVGLDTPKEFIRDNT